MVYVRIWIIIDSILMRRAEISSNENIVDMISGESQDSSSSHETKEDSLML